jgi:hypothetical protein
MDRFDCRQQTEQDFYRRISRNLMIPDSDEMNQKVAPPHLKVGKWGGAV